MKITITGTPGSGKGTLAMDLAAKLNLKVISIGDMRRERARERNMSLAEFNELGEKEDWTDRDADEYQKKYGEEHDNFIMDSRLGWYFIPDSIKIFLDANEDLRARRLLNRPRRSESFEKLQEVLESNKKRIESDKRRYKKYYNIDMFNPKNFDLIIESLDENHHVTAERALKLIKKFQEDHKV